MCAPRMLEVAKDGWGPACEDSRISAQCRDHGGGKLIPFLDARARRRTLRMERALGEIDDLLELGDELDERAVTPRRTSGSHPGARIFAAH